MAEKTMKGVETMINKFPKGPMNSSNLIKTADAFQKHAATDLGITQENADTQATALKQFASGQMDYASMRMMCG